jgi:hypothetical protein
MLEALAKEPMGTIRNALVDEERGTGGQFGRLLKEFRERADMGPVSLQVEFLKLAISMKAGSKLKGKTAHILLSTLETNRD